MQSAAPLMKRSESAAAPAVMVTVTVVTEAEPSAASEKPSIGPTRPPGTVLLAGSLPLPRVSAGGGLELDEPHAARSASERDAATRRAAE